MVILYITQTLLLLITVLQLELTLDLIILKQEFGKLLVFVCFISLPCTLKQITAQRSLHKPTLSSSALFILISVILQLGFCFQSSLCILLCFLKIFNCTQLNSTAKFICDHIYLCCFYNFQVERTVSPGKLPTSKLSISGILLIRT